MGAALTAAARHGDVVARAAALRKMPDLRELHLSYLRLSDAAAAAIFGASARRVHPALTKLRSLHITHTDMTPPDAADLAASGWRLEELALLAHHRLGAAGVAALVAAPTFALRRLQLVECHLDVAALLALVDAPWPLEELDLSLNDFRAAAAGPALVALAQRVGMRRLAVNDCRLRAAGFKALVEAVCPALTHLAIRSATAADDGPDALGAAAFAGLPALEELDLSSSSLGPAAALRLAARPRARLRRMNLSRTRIGDAGFAALAGGSWAALEWLDLCGNHLTGEPTLEEARRWAPCLSFFYAE